MSRETVTSWLQLPRLHGAREILDRSDNSDEDVRENLRDIERLNRTFGGVRTVILQLSLLLGETTQQPISQKPLTIMDIATGGADIPRAICLWARKRALAVSIEAVDQSDQVLAAATEWSRDFPEISFHRVQAPHLPYPDRSFDYVLASLFFHHLSERDGIFLLREMARVARCGLLVNDLLRSRIAHLLTTITTRLMSANRLTLHDGPLSVLRGFRPQELRHMAAEAGLSDVELNCYPWFRVTLTKKIAPFS